MRAISRCTKRSLYPISSSQRISIEFLQRRRSIPRDSITNSRFTALNLVMNPLSPMHFVRAVSRSQCCAKKLPANFARSNGSKNK